MRQLSATVARKISRRSAVVAVVLAILVVTLRPVGGHGREAFSWCVGCSELGTLDLLYNMALFVPLGLLLARTGMSAPQALLLAAGLSWGIELVQLFVPGRDPSFSDVVANSLGGALGVPLSRAPEFFQRATKTHWRLVAWSYAALGMGATALGAWVVTVPVPESDFYVQWLPQRFGYVRFRGDLQSFQVNGVVLDSAARVPAGTFPAEFFEQGPDARLRLTAGAHISGMAMIARLALEHGEFLMLGRQADALAVRYRTRAPQIGIRSPILALDGAFTDDPAAELEIRAIKRHDDVELYATTLSGASTSIARHDRLTAARFWATLLPFERAFGSLALLGDVLWVMLLVAPAAYAGARGYGGLRRFVGPAAQGVTLAFFANYVQPSLWWWPVWLGFALGAAVGISLGQRGITHGSHAAA